MFSEHSIMTFLTPLSWALLGAMGLNYLRQIHYAAKDITGELSSINLFLRNNPALKAPEEDEESTVLDRLTTMETNLKKILEFQETQIKALEFIVGYIRSAQGPRA